MLNLPQHRHHLDEVENSSQMEVTVCQSISVKVRRIMLIIATTIMVIENNKNELREAGFAISSAIYVLFFSQIVVVLFAEV